MSSRPTKFLIIDGIGGVPLGREIGEAFAECGIPTARLDALKLPVRRFYKVRSAWHKFRNKLGEKDAFHNLPRLRFDLLEKRVVQEQPTHILVVGFVYKHFDPAEVKRLAESVGAQLMIYDTDSCNLYSKRREFIYFIEHELPIYDLIFSFSKVTTRFFRDTLRLNAVHLPFGAKQLPKEPVALRQDVVFIGSADLRRVFLLEHVREWLSVRGARWARNFPLISVDLRKRIDDRPIWDDELISLLQSAKIVLNITRSDFYGAETGVNLRIFEALAAGCFLLTDYCEEVTEIFTPGVHLDVFRSASELRQKVEYYLAHPHERERIAENGYNEFLAAHGWSARVKQILAHTSVPGV
ncbi:glycosyltransferase [Pseudomonas sp. PS1]|uniref:Glycosyltransferase n=1 Tax=Stutzerimonas marianensis TaxID=2929513 RepID=A0A9X2AQI0_9GAMM|nr:glycosyltransferase [Pseudomonas marianensis]MCJ0971884.1 glycosyltransferase [Pseudomonas marianensis]